MAGNQNRDYYELFTLTFRKHYSRLCTYACGFLKDENEAQELVMDVFTEAWQRRIAFKNPSHLIANLTFLVKNRSLNFIKKAKRQPVFLDIEDVNSPNVSTEFKMFEYYKDVDLHKQILDAVYELPAGPREVLLLFCKEQKTTKEIAQELSLSEDNVRKHKSNGIKILRLRFINYNAQLDIEKLLTVLFFIYGNQTFNNF